ncbi:MAG: FAD-dependent oxidoreductase [Candidatus Hydrogenedentes bacterium]|nr:FAD-dependent oxidoreductase [Candidatus Hydrogenedentota bacterium]
MAPSEIVVEKGKAVGVKCNRMFLGEFDKSGRRRPEVSVDGTFVVEVDQVIAAIGQSLDTAEVMDGVALKLTVSKYIWADALSAQTSVPWVFSGGDAAMGPSSVADAIGAGERAAVGIDKFLTGAEHAFWRGIEQVSVDFDPDADPVDYPRTKPKMIPVNNRKNNFNEVEVALTEAAAMREAKRCLRCDYRATCEV